MNQHVHRFGNHHAMFGSGVFAEITSRDISSYDERAFARFQRRTLEWELRSLLDACRQRLAYSFALLHPAAPQPEALQRSGCLERMVLHWDRLCVFYRRNHFDPQLDFFDCHSLREERRWRRFIETTCTEPFTNRHEWTRSILEGAGVILKVPHSTSIPIEDLFDAIVANLEGEEHDLDWLM